MCVGCVGLLCVLFHKVLPDTVRKMHAAGLRIRDRDKMSWEKRSDAKAIQMAAASEQEAKAARKAPTPKRRERMKTYHGLVKTDTMVKQATRRD